MKALFLVIVGLSMVSICLGAGGDMGVGTEPLTDGSAGYPYLIEDVNDFDVFAGNSSYWASGVHTALACDPNLAGRTYTTAVIAPDTPDTSSSFNGIPFQGVLDGDDHIISNLTIDTAEVSNGYLGLFGSINGVNAEVKNLGIVNCNITGGDSSECLGGLCGWAEAGNIANCHAIGSLNGYRTIGGLCGFNGTESIITNCYTISVVEGDNFLGGLCGGNQGTIADCNSIGQVFGNDYLGGLCGSNYQGNITNCYAANTVSSLVTHSDHLGGLCGKNTDGTISNCFSSGSISGYRLLGGLCGFNDNGIISNCFSTGAVSGAHTIGGLCGSNEYGKIANCHSTGSVNATSDTVGGLCGINNNSGTIVDCYSTGSVTGNDYLGGLCGQSHSGSISGCYSTGTVNGDYCLGGLCGYNSGSGMLINCNSTGTVTCSTSSRNSGGLCGLNRGTIDSCYSISLVTGYGYNNLGGLCGMNEGGMIINCHSEGSISGGEYPYNVGGLCGQNNSGTISDCYSTGSVSGYESLGGLCGRNNTGLIENCYSIGSVLGDSSSLFLGGLCGWNQSGTLSNCYSSSFVSGVSGLGGLCGRNATGTIIACYSTGLVSSPYDNMWLGGLCGINYYGEISFSYSISTVTGGGNSLYLGGLCGFNNSGSVSSCYSTGTVSGGSYLGGLCGYQIDQSSGLVEISDCFWDTDTSGTVVGYNLDPDDPGAITNVVGKVTGEMQDPNTFLVAGWDFVGENVNGTDDYWRLCMDGIDYPQLSWQWAVGDVTCPDGVELSDLAYIASRYLEVDCDGSNNCGNADIDRSRDVDWPDVMMLAENWLGGGI